MTNIHSPIRSSSASRACTTSSSSYIQATVEKSIHKHRVVIFSQTARCPLTSQIQILLEDTPGTPFLAHEIKIYHLEDFPAQREIERDLRVLAGESLERKKLQQEHKRSHSSETRQPTSPKHSPTSSSRHRSHGTSSSSNTIIDAIPCYVFVSGVFLSYKEIQDLFVKVAPKDPRTKSFVDYLKRHEYHGKRLMELPVQQQSDESHSGHHVHHVHHTSHQTHTAATHHSHGHQQHSPHRPPKTRSSSTSPTYSKKAVITGHHHHRRTTSLDDTTSPTPKTSNHHHHQHPSHPYAAHHHHSKSPPSLDSVMEE